MKKLWSIIFGAGASLVLAISAHAWNDAGHKVVARIAWENMTPQTRAKVIALLKAAPSDADLGNLLATDARPLPVREQEFFLLASIWADMLRDGKFPARREKYHKSSWHYINFFWEQSAPGGVPNDRVDMKPEPENIVERLQYLQSFIADTTKEPSQRAIALAWVLHLAGDIHQPLHTSARVTASEPQGDRGGNLFVLDTTSTVRNLHSYWDGILNLSFDRKSEESDDAYINRLAQAIASRHPKKKMQSRLMPGQFDAWAKAGYANTKSIVYPSWLRRYEMPPTKYRKSAHGVAEPALALAGYRLAEMLNRLFTKAPANLSAPEWAKGAVWYQIFPERFRNGDPANDADAEDAGIQNYPNWQVSPWTSDWYKAQPWEKATGWPFYKFVFERRYGGDLQGVIEKLDYLQDLGVTAIYFNPIFEAKSLHKYDASSYHHIDDNFGPDPARDKALVATETEDPKTWKWTTADSLFLHFIKEAHRRNIRVIIDGVFNHVGRDFWAFRDLIKNQQNSRYKDWFVVRAWDDPKTPKDEFDYQSWWDTWTLPVFREDANGIVPGPREYIFAITKRWMDPNGDGDPSDGIDGWRLDVSEDVSPKFWVEWCALVRSLNPNSYTTGEIWKLAPDWLKGDRYDAVMNYPVAYAMRNFFIGGEEKWGPSRFDAELNQIRANYSEATNHLMQVLIGSHDTERLASMIKNAGTRGYDQRASCRDNPNYDPRQPNAEERKTQKMIVAFMATYAGAPMIYYGDEAGMWGGDDPDDRKPMVWPDLRYENETYSTVTKFTDSDPVAFDHELFYFYKKVLRLRQNHSALRQGTITTLHKDDAAGIYAFRRDFENDAVIAVFNLSTQPRKITLTANGADGKHFREVLSGKASTVHNAVLQIELAPRSATIWE